MCQFTTVIQTERNDYLYSNNKMNEKDGEIIRKIISLYNNVVQNFTVQKSLNLTFILKKLDNIRVRFLKGTLQ